MPEILTAALYHFADLPDCAALRDPLQAECDRQGVRGLLLLAPEGVNGTIAGSSAGVRAVLDMLRAQPPLAALRHKEAWGDRMPFYRMRVRVKREIVTLGVPGLNAARDAGTYVKPAQWNALIDDPDVVVIDVRNGYESAIGSFAGAVRPDTRSFTEFPAWVEAQSAPGGLLEGRPRVAMFCTGGIRCEKSTALLRMQGFGEVYHLEGGILQYLEDVPADGSRWEGDCFVFDERVSVAHGLAPGTHQDLCRSCRMPLSPQDLASPDYVAGVRCPHCHGSRPPEQERALAERERQMALARQRGTEHLGARLAAPGGSGSGSGSQSVSGHSAQTGAAPAASLPVLYTFRRCPYAIRARMAIAASGQRCEWREVVLRDKPAALLGASPKGTVPVLVLPEGHVLEQSLDIMRWALGQGDPQGWLRAGAQDEVQALIASCDGPFKQALDRCKYPERHPGLPPGEAQSQAGAWLRGLEERLARSRHLCGNAASLADVALMPFVRQYAAIDRAAWAAQPWPHLQAWLAAWEGGALWERVMHKAPAWREGQETLCFPPDPDRGASPGSFGPAG
ncbi:rhodanese-related sulfurtransferase [Acidovorax sp. PRC11]|uniref:oxygen-dependent tRNA uridine(34) hydroxylase TrhO n=2 Tax=Pseudomonadota TaxID=1224 RepID=UPI0028833999|nr:rhodanese-related sulfurtransferase [Acidovorax sp. PRC11]